MKLSLLLLATATLSLSACATNTPVDKKSNCMQAKRQAVFNSTVPGYNPQYLTHAQNQALQDKAAANC